MTDIDKRITEYESLCNAWFDISGRKDKVRERRFVLGEDVIEYSKRINKTPLEYTPKDLYLLFFKEIKIKTISEYNSFKNGFSQMYEYAISVGATSRNITNDALFSTEVARKNIGDINDYLSPQDVSAILNSIKRNRVYGQALFLSLYENVGRTCRELSRIKTSDIDFNKRKIRRDNGVVIGISKTLISLYHELTQIDSYESRSGQQFGMDRMYDSLFPRLAYADTKDYDEGLYSEKLSVNLSAEIRRISKDIDYSLSARIIYESGMFNNVSDYIGGKDVMIDALVSNNRAKNALLKKALEHFGYSINITSFKYAYRGMAQRAYE